MDHTTHRETASGLITMESIYARNPMSPIAREKNGPQQYAGLAAMLHDLLQNRLSGETADDVRTLPFTPLFALAEMLVFSVIKNPALMLETARPSYQGDPLVCHSLNVAFLSCKVGLQLDLSLRECAELGVAALLHDIGMTKIDPSYYAHGRDLSKEELRQIERHPQTGYAFFTHLRNDFPWLLNVILEEHKRENGKGYGAQVEGEMHTFSRIVGICDSYEALIHQRPFRKPFHPADAMKTIIADRESLYNKTILRAVIESIGMYPVGSMVKLNNNKTAQVIQTVGGSPLRPIVSAWDEHDESAKPGIIDLSKDVTIYVQNLVYTDDYVQPHRTSSEP